MRGAVKKGVKLCANHEPKAKLGRMLVVMPPSKRRDRAEIAKRLAEGTRGTRGAFGRSKRGARAPRDEEAE